MIPLLALGGDYLLWTAHLTASPSTRSRHLRFGGAAGTPLDMVQHLKDLAKLKYQGILTEDGKYRA
jgi:hypothetical protein